MEATFTVEDPVQRYLSAFREVITAETQIDVERLDLPDDGLRLWYRTPNTYRDEAFGAEVGFVAGAYAVLLGEGLPATRLRVSATDGDDHMFDTLERRDP